MVAQEHRDGHGKFELYEDEADLNLPPKGWCRIVLDYPKCANPIFDGTPAGVLIQDEYGQPLRGKFIRVIMHEEDRT